MLLYLVKHSRPDIANAVRELTKCMDKRTPVSYHEILRVVRFVLHTKDLGLKICPIVDFIAPLWELLSLSDSDHAGANYVEIQGTEDCCPQFNCG
jgi:hypothetical protein